MSVEDWGLVETAARRVNSLFFNDEPTEGLWPATFEASLFAYFF
jgi:hypothetical protein